MTNTKNDQAKPTELTEEATDKVQGGALEIVFSDILVSSVNDDRPKGSNEHGLVVTDADLGAIVS